MDTYERRLAENPRWCLEEGGKFFEATSSVHKTLRGIAERLTELNIPYAVCGGMALNAHGFRRFTEDVDILVTKESLQKIHSELTGRGYLQPFEQSKNLRDTDTKVKIEFLITGQYPGDGKPKPVMFPDPATSAFVVDGIQYLRLEPLIELKLSSGISAAHRRKDLADVQELIRILKLPWELSDNLSPYVRDMYQQLWQEVADAPEDE
ncbi:hypothetical protein GC163_02180 [bacterium]|nr:hypothetical protein [bacterium]